jgi:GNAT superfamily N-acetyltransferase
MPDLLVKLYDLPPIDGKLESLRSEEIRLRPAMAYEKHQVVGWVTKHFSDGWASECDVAFSNSPISCHIATKDGAILGFACYDSTSRGMFGPFGVAESARGQGIGRRLLLSSLEAMKAVGYAYAIIGNARSVEYYSHIINIIEIPDSNPGIYLDRLAR